MMCPLFNQTQADEIAEACRYREMLDTLNVSNIKFKAPSVFSDEMCMRKQCEEHVNMV